MLAIYLLYILYLVTLVAGTYFKIVPQYVTILYPLQIALGLYATTNGYYYIFALLLILELLLVINAYINKLEKKSEVYSQGTSIAYRFNRAFYWTIVLFIIYHYAAAGIPALSSNVALARFDNTSSGLFGIPGRMVLFGKTYLLFYSYYFFSRRNKIGKYKEYSTYFYIALAINIIIAFFSGSKGSILNLWTLIVYFFAFGINNYNIRKFFNRKIVSVLIIIAILGFSYFAFFFRKYNNQFSNMNMYDYIGKRMTSIMTDASSFLLNNKGDIHITYLDDFIFYLQKYFHFVIPGCYNIQSLEVYCSNSVNHITFTGPYSFSVPVTIGAIPEFIYHFSFASIIAISILGWFYGYLYKKLKKASKPFNYSHYCFLLVFTIDFLTKGNLAYHVINGVLFYIIMVALYKVTQPIKLHIGIRKKNNRTFARKNENYNEEHS